MNLYATIFILYLLSAGQCQNGGVKVIINQRLIDSLVTFFLQKYNAQLQLNKIGDKGIAKNLAWGIRDLTRDKITLNFENKGYIHAHIAGINPFLNGKILGKKFEVKASKVKIDLKVKIESETLPNGKYKPKVYISESPTVDFSVSSHISGGFGGWLLNLISKPIVYLGKIALNLVKDTLCIFFKNIANNTLLNNIPTETPIISSKNIYMDFTLASPIKLNNNFLEINSIAHLFNKNLNETKAQASKYPLTYLPSFTYAQNHLQLYVSEYFLNSAIYTLLRTNAKQIIANTNTNLIGAFLPGLIDSYGNKPAILRIDTINNSNVKLTQNSLNINALGNFLIFIDGESTPVYICQIELSLIAKLLIKSGKLLTGELDKITATVKNIYLRNNPKITTPKVGEVITFIDQYFKPIINGIIPQDYVLPFPEVMGIQFRDISLEIKDQYFVVNYNFNQN